MDQLFEYTTSIGVVRGMFSKPNTSIYPVLLVMHGFQGDSIGPQYLFRTFQKQCVKQGIGVLRFDYIGCGNSDGDFIENNLSKSITQSEELLNFLHTQNEVSDIYALGFSMGGVVASEIVKRHPQFVKKLLLWSPAGNLGELLVNLYKNGRQLSDNRCEFGGLILRKEVVEDALSFDYYKDLSLYKQSLCIIHGSCDQVVPIKWGQKYFDNFNCEKIFHEVRGSDHTYDGHEYRQFLYQYSLDFLV